MTEPVETSNFEKEFIEKNRSFWDDLFLGKRQDGGYVLIRNEQYPLILLGLAQLGAFAAARKNAGLLFILPSRSQKDIQAVLSSFPRASFIYEDSPRYLFLKVYSYLQALFAFNFKTPDDLLDFESEGIKFGDLVYDAYLANKKNATLRNPRDPVLLKTLRDFFYVKGLVEDVLKRYRVILGVTGHVIGTGGGVFLRLLRQEGIEVWEKADALRKHTAKTGFYDCYMTPERKDIELMVKQKERFLPLAEAVLSKRFNNLDPKARLGLPYSRDKKLFRDKNDFCACFGLDPQKKNIFVMLHAFNDFPHIFGRLLHRDYYQWFKAIFEAAVNNDKVNWIFKEHPYVKYYPAKDVDLPGVFGSCQKKHLRYLDTDASFNTASLRYLADAVVTCTGTAGLEYSTYGVPCLLAGPCWYAKFGFTVDPETPEEFKKRLMEIDSLQPLSDEQVVMAKLLAYFTFELIDPGRFPDPFGIVPTIDFCEQKTFPPERIFQKILEARKQSSELDKKSFIALIDKFIDDPDFIRFWDLNRNPELAEAELA